MMMIGISGHGVGKCSHWHEKGSSSCKTGPSTFSSDSIPPLFQCLYSSNCTFSATYLISHLYWFLSFTLQVDISFPFPPKDFPWYFLPSQLTAMWWLLPTPTFIEAVLSKVASDVVTKLFWSFQAYSPSSPCLPGIPGHNSMGLLPLSLLFL